MSSRIIEGRALAKKLRAEHKQAVLSVLDARGTPPGLAIILVGDDPASPRSRSFTIFSGYSCRRRRRCRTDHFSMVRTGAVVVHVGINRLADGRIIEDVDFEGATKASYISLRPVALAQDLHHVAAQHSGLGAAPIEQALSDFYKNTVTARRWGTTTSWDRSVSCITLARWATP